MSPFTYYNIVPIIVPSPLHKAICYSYVFFLLAGTHWFFNEYYINSNCGVVPQHLWSENI